MAGRPIDEKIVAMKMDNSDFKQKAIETTGLFGKLRDSMAKITGVNLGGVTNQFGNIQNAAGKVDMTGLANNVETVASRFSNLGVVATTALMNITNRAVDAGLALYKSLTVGPVMDGFREYELKMGSIQTMLSNTEWEHSTLKDVKKVLGELNNYADKTIYDFGQMTSAIGKWTAAGVGLKDSAIAIKGMGNLAAVSGASVDQLNTAMYQMSQGMAAGKFGAIDWISMTNAGMGGKKTQDALLATAKAMGKNIDMSNGFKASLEQGWLTSKVFLATMKQFGNDKSMTEAATSVRTFTGMIAALKEGVGSGWAETWELVFGDFEVATKRWTALSKVIGGLFQKSTDARNKFVKSLADHGVFQTMFSGVTALLNGVLMTFTAIGKGFGKVFSAPNLSAVKDFARGFRDFFVEMSPTRESFQKIADMSQAVFSALKFGIKVVINFGKALINAIPPGTGAAVLDLLQSMGKMVIAFATSEKVMKAISIVFETISTTIRNVIGAAISLGKAIWNLFPSGLGDSMLQFVEYISDLIIKFDESSKKGNGLHATVTGLSWVFTILGGVAGAVNKAFDNLGGAISQASSILSKGVFSDKGPWQKDSKIVDWLFKIRAGFKDLSKSVGSIKFSFEPIANFFENMFSMIGKGFEWVKDKVSGFGDSIKNAMPSGGKLFAGGFLASMIAIVGLVIKAWWDLKDVFLGWGKIGAGITEVLEGVGGAFKAFSMNMHARSLVIIAIAVGLLAGSLLVLSRIPVDRVTDSLISLTTILTALIGGMAIMTKYDITGSGMKAAMQMVGMGLAILIIASALKKLGDLKPSELQKGIISLVAIMGTLAGAFTLMSKFGGSKVGASALQIIAIAASVHLLVSAIKKIAEVKPDDLKKGLITIGIILLEIGTFLKIAGGSKFGIGSTLGMLAIGKAIKNIVSAVKEINKIDPEQMKVGLKTIGIILAEIAIFALLTGKMGLFQVGVGMLMISAALTALIVPIAILGNMKMETLGKGLGAIAVALLAIGLTSKLMTTAALSGAGLILIAIGLTALLVPISAFAAMSWGALLKGMTGLALTLLIVGGAAALLTPAIPSVIAFGVGLLALGAGMALAGIGAVLLANGLLALATLTSGAVTVIVATLGTLLAGLVSLIPLAVDFIVKLFMQILSAIAREIPNIVALFANMLVQILNKIAEYIPKIVDAAVKIVTNFLDAIAEKLPEIVDSAANLMVAFVDSLASAVETNGPKFLDAMMRLMSQCTLLMVQAGVMVVNALFGWIPGVTEATNKIGETAESTIKSAFDAKGAGEEKGKDFASGLESKKTDAETAGKNVAEQGKTGASGVDLMTIGQKKGQDFATALSSKAGDSKTSGINLATAGKTGAGSIDMSKTGEYFGAGFASGMEKQSTMDKVINAATGLAHAAWSKLNSWLDINSPSRLLMESGGWFGEGFAIGIANKTKQVASKAKDLAMTAKDSINRFIDGFELPDGENELHFKAVVDYESVDPSKFGNISPMTIRPDTSLTNGLVSLVSRSKQANISPVVTVASNDNKEKNQTPVVKQPAVIQVVTPEKREVASWLVDDITEFQEFKINRNKQF